MLIRVSNKFRQLDSNIWDGLEGPKPPAPHLFRNNGCTASPDYIRGKEVWPACVIHDYQYNIGTTDRKKSDAIFRRNLKYCLKAFGMNRFSATLYSFIYWRAVRRLGKSFYNAAGDPR